MKTPIFYSFFIFGLFLSSICSAQIVTEHADSDLPVIEVSTNSIQPNDEHQHCDHKLFIIQENINEVTGIMSLDEIISSDDLSDFRCTGGFCMNESHSHKKGLSFQKQLFKYFMKISI